MDEQLPLIAQIIFSVIAGHSAPPMLRQTTFGPIGRSLLGAVGGVGGSIFLKLIVSDKIAEGMNTLAGSAVSGAALGALFCVMISALYAHLNSNKNN